MRLTRKRMRTALLFSCWFTVGEANNSQPPKEANEGWGEQHGDDEVLLPLDAEIISLRDFLHPDLGGL